ncbi:MAG: TPM domain-containing protein, partial [Propionibacteriaceae bacterium]|nr:TPM domain-containing protein [Propionibacteriaceae bacterium]
MAGLTGLFGWLAPTLAEADPVLVSDEASLLSPADEATLTSRAEQIRETYGFTVLIHTLPSLNGVDVQVANRTYFNQQAPGADGITFLIAMATRDANIWTTPGRGETSFTVYGREKIASQVQSLLSEGDYGKAFGTFLDLVDEFLAEAATGQPYDSGHRYLTYNPAVVAAIIGAAVGLLSAGITVLVWKRKLKTARPATAAAEYETPGSLQITVQQDEHINSHTAVVPIPQVSSSGGGGGFSSGG